MPRPCMQDLNRRVSTTLGAARLSSRPQFVLKPCASVGAGLNQILVKPGVLSFVGAERNLTSTREMQTQIFF